LLYKFRNFPPQPFGVLTVPKNMRYSFWLRKTKWTIYIYVFDKFG